MGVPARIVRELTSAELSWKAAGTREYQELAVRCLSTLEECEPLAAPEPNRGRLGVSTAVPLHTLNRGK
jgi:phenylacetic acid degradation protein